MPAGSDGQVRRLFRQLRTEDHFANPEGLFGLQQYVTGDWCILHVRGTGVTLYTLDIDPNDEHHRDLLNTAHRHAVQWANRQMRWRWMLVASRAMPLHGMLY